jgi:excinuclease ABC subunit C
MDNLKQIVEALPKDPGVYQFFNKKNEIIYIGKAKNLHSRVSSYFSTSRFESYKTKILAGKTSSIKHIVVESETDALLLENILIKKYQPKYNILLKDDKTFPWICIKNEKYPRVYSTRKIIRDGSDYFGPYTSALMVKILLNLIRHLYQLRTCNFSLNRENIKKKKFKKCLEYHIGNCNAPCEELQSEEEYNNSISVIKKILKGNIQEVISYLKTLMNDLAAQYKFENAESIRQKIILLEKYRSKSTIVNPHYTDIDVFSYLEIDNKVAVNYLKVIHGSIVQSHTVELVRKLDENREELLIFAIIDIRNKIGSDSKEILIPFSISPKLEGIRFTVPKTGDKKKLLELSARNAKQYFAQVNKLSENKSFNNRSVQLLEKVKEDFQLKELPIQIECFDNSNIQGEFPVAACVVFINGRPAKREYRRYNIKTVEGANDFASVGEIVYRRYKRLLEEKKPLPKLIVIDGGKGQLNSAVQSLQKLDLYNRIPIIGIAKKLEEIYFPHDSIPLYLDKNSPSLKLIQNIRNEAHRFGIIFHRDKRSANQIESQLIKIAGIGKMTEEKLLKAFGSVENIKSKSLAELQKLVGIRLAQIIKDGLK